MLSDLRFILITMRFPILLRELGMKLLLQLNMYCHLDGIMTQNKFSPQLTLANFPIFLLLSSWVIKLYRPSKDGIITSIPFSLQDKVHLWWSFSDELNLYGIFLLAFFFLICSEKQRTSHLVESESPMPDFYVFCESCLPKEKAI